MLTFPSGLNPVSGGFAQSVKSLSGGQSLSGFEQVTSQLSDRWTASFSFNINSDARVLAFRAFVMAMRGRFNTVLLPVFDLARAPWALDAAGRAITPSAARSPRLDGTVYADASTLRAGLISAQMDSFAPLNATAITIDMLVGSAPQPGHFFSNGNRLHTVLDVSGTGPYTIDIWPWIRADTIVGTPLNFAAPVCEMRFASDTEGASALTSLEYMRFGTITLKFDEVPA
jgi:hypothetical protein